MSASTETTPTIREFLNLGYEPPWAEVIRSWKADWVRMTDGGEMPPVVLAMRGDNCMATAVAPQVDNDLGFKAASMLKQGVEPDALWFIADAHMAVMPMPKGMSPREAMDKAEAKYPPGSMQKACDEQGACETGEMTDCIIVARVDRAGLVWVDTIPYSYHGKGTTFRWWKEGVQRLQAGSNDPDRLCGHVPATLRRIMRLPGAIYEPRIRQVMARDSISPERAQAVLAESMKGVLEQQGYGCDLFIPPRPLTSLRPATTL